MTIRFIKDGQDMPNGYQAVAYFNDGCYAMRGSAKQLEIAQRLVIDTLEAGKAIGIREASNLPDLTPTELEALTT